VEKKQARKRDVLDEKASKQRGQSKRLNKAAARSKSKRREIDHISAKLVVVVTKK